MEHKKKIWFSTALATILFISVAFAADFYQSSYTCAEMETLFDRVTTASGETGIIICDGAGTFSGITTSAGLRGQISDETGTGVAVFGTSPTLGTPTLTNPVLDGNITGTAFLDEDDMASNSATSAFSQQSLVSYITSGSVTMASKTLTSPVLNGTLSGTAFLDEDDMSSDSATSVASQQSIKAHVAAGTITMTNKTLTSPVINTGVSGTAILDEDDMASDSNTQLATQQSIKAYVDSMGGKKYYPDAAESDQGATASGDNQTVYDILQDVGTSKYATIVLRHTGAGATTDYTWDTSLDFTTYPYVYIYFEPGARLARTTGDEVLTVYSAANIICQPNQQITAVDMVDFYYGGDVYPEWWGGSAHDSTDDLNPIQYAINSISGSHPGGTVKLDRGMYLLSSYVEITSDGVRLEGKFPGWYNEDDSTILRVTAANSTVIYAHGPGTGVRIKNLSFKNFLVQYGTGSDDDTNTSGQGIDLQYVIYSEISNVRFNNICVGIKLTECIDLLIEKVFYQRLYAVPAGNSYGIYADGSTGTGNASITIKDSIIVYPPDPADHTGTGYGIYSSGTIVQDYTIENVELGRMDVGIYFEATGTYKYDIKIHAVICDMIFGYGIQLVDFGDTGMVQVTGSYFASASAATGTFAGIYLSAVTGVVIANNQFLGYTAITETGNYGILMSADTQYCNIANNQFRNQYIPIGISNGSKNNISGNTFYGDSSHTANNVIYLVNGSANVINGNIIGGYATTAINLAASSATSQVKHNEIVGANITTKLANAGTGNIIRDNTGWVTESSGTSGAIATGATIAHGLSTTPTVVNLTSTDAGVTAIYWSANATNITVNYAGGGTHAFHWEAKVR